MSRILEPVTHTKVLPRVAVLLASYNGIAWIEAQVASILGQVDVELKLFVSDDQSTDGTLEWLMNLASRDPRVILLHSLTRSGGAGKNFYRLFMNAKVDEYDFVALADQDDVWLSNKLSMQIELANRHTVDGVSSNVVAYWADGSRAFINKAQPMRKLDFLFESAGPGCSFLLTTNLARRVQFVLVSNHADALTVELHDWLIYTVCRATGMYWHIDERPTLKYRQHEHNVVGVNFGPIAWCKRLKRIRDGWYRYEVCKLARLAKFLTQDRYLSKACDTILNEQLLDRVRLLRYVNQSRRALGARVFLGILMALCIF